MQCYDYYYQHHSRYLRRLHAGNCTSILNEKRLFHEMIPQRAALRRNCTTISGSFLFAFFMCRSDRLLLPPQEGAPYQDDELQGVLPLSRVLFVAVSRLFQEVYELYNDTL